IVTSRPWDGYIHTNLVSQELIKKDSSMKTTLKIFALLASLAPLLALGHGTMETPNSRIYRCYLEGPEHPTSAACAAAIAAMGTTPIYTWNEVNQANANDN